jgi:hypothetical protein
VASNIVPHVLMPDSVNQESLAWMKTQGRHALEVPGLAQLFVCLEVDVDSDAEGHLEERGPHAEARGRLFDVCAAPSLLGEGRYIRR